ncbi:MAG: S-formylglutathione hydrolase [Sneathiellaceae bacterium]|uniref:S-formylglutathione hydrolase n=1 Tax=Thalassobaculum sp. TaxID=2022740 RepID=UPI0032EB07E5
MSIEIAGRHRTFEGETAYCRHQSAETRSQMAFAVYTPPAAANGPVPVVFWLAGLTCTEETFMIKAGAQRLAAELGIMLVAPDTSPRGLGLPGEADDWDFGTGAGFYLDATQAPWAANYRMASYVVEELPRAVAANFPADPERMSIMGHSMGGHGALVLGLRNATRYRAISAFAPIANPMDCPWGHKAFGNYLGADRAAWASWDATDLLRSGRAGWEGPPILVDQGRADPFLAEQLKPEAFQAACAATGTPFELYWRDGYDHGYFFISTFMESHLRHHARAFGLTA